MLARRIASSSAMFLQLSVPWAGRVFVRIRFSWILPTRWQAYHDILDNVFRAGLVDRQSRVIVEHHCKAALPGDAERFERTRIVRQSDKCLSFYAVKN